MRVAIYIGLFISISLLGVSAAKADIYKAHLTAGPWNQLVFPCGSSQTWLIRNRQQLIDEVIEEYAALGFPEGALHPMYFEFRGILSPGKCAPDQCADVFVEVTEVLLIQPEPPDSVMCPWPPQANVE